MLTTRSYAIWLLLHTSQLSLPSEDSAVKRMQQRALSAPRVRAQPTPRSPLDFAIDHLAALKGGVGGAGGADGGTGGTPLGRSPGAPGMRGAGGRRASWAKLDLAMLTNRYDPRSYSPSDEEAIRRSDTSPTGCRRQLHASLRGVPKGGQAAKPYVKSLRHLRPADCKRPSSPRGRSPRRLVPSADKEKQTAYMGNRSFGDTPEDHDKEVAAAQLVLSVRTQAAMASRGAGVGANTQSRGLNISRNDR